MFLNGSKVVIADKKGKDISIPDLCSAIKFPMVVIYN
jgi:hypothetical protein